MEKIIINEHTGWEYELQGDYYYPTGRVMRNSALTPAEMPEDNAPEEEKSIGIWGQRHLRYIRQYKKITVFRFVRLRKAERLYCRCKHASGGSLPSDSKRNGHAGGHDRKAQNRKSNGLGTADE